MKKQQLTSCLCAIFLFYIGCKKNATTNSPSGNNLLIENAQQYFKDSVAVNSINGANLSNLRLSTGKDPIWQNAHVLQLSKYKAVLVPLCYSKTLYMHGTFEGNNLFLLDNIAQLLIYKDSAARYHSFVVTSFPDSNYLTSNSTRFTGIIFVDDWSGNSINKYKYCEDGNILRYNPGGQRGSANVPLSVAPTTTEPTLVISVCSEIDGYNYSADDPDDGYSWSESGGCNTYYFADDGEGGSGPSGSDLGSAGGGGGGEGSKLTSSNLIVAGADAPIANIQSYFNCFTNSGAVDHTYSIQVCVDQPITGSRTPWGITNGGPGGSSAAGNVVNVGHTFLVLSENSAGTIINRNVGFYPSGAISPLSPESQGVLNNDASHSYDISLTITVTNLQFYDILNYVSLGNNTGFDYNLNSDNCTTFALNALAKAGINLPATQGSWPLGSGDDPGDLGEDIRQMPLSSNMTRSTMDNSHPNVGSCN